VAKKQVSVVVAAVAVDLAANFAARPARAVDIYVSSPGTNRTEQFIELSCRDSSFIRKISNVRGGDSA
jgi:hypothetical protein